MEGQRARRRTRSRSRRTSKALAAQAQGEFDARDQPDRGRASARPTSRPTQVVDAHAGRSPLDEGPRADTTAEGLAKLRPVFAAKGSVTAGNSSQMSDGAAARC